MTVFSLYQVIAIHHHFVQAQLFVESLDKTSTYLQKNDPAQTSIFYILLFELFNKNVDI